LIQLLLLHSARDSTWAKFACSFEGDLEADYHSQTLWFKQRLETNLYAAIEKKGGVACKLGKRVEQPRKKESGRARSA
jgi:hypothetical protein